MPRFSLCCPVCKTTVPVDPSIPLDSHHCLRCGKAFATPPGTRTERRTDGDLQIDPAAVFEAASRPVPRRPGAVPQRDADALRSAAFPVRRAWSTVQNPPPPPRPQTVPWIPGLIAVTGTIALCAAFTWRSGAQLPHAGDAGQLLAREKVEDDTRRHAIQSVAQNFISARTADEARPFLRPSANLERSLASWHLAGGRFPIGWTIHSVSPTDSPSVLNLWSVGATDAAAIRRYLDVVETPAGPRIDFESFAGSGDMTWREFMTSRPSTPTLLRLRLLQDDFYNRTFIDRTRWACLRIYDPTDTAPVFAYLNRSAASNRIALGKVVPAPRGGEVRGSTPSQLAETYACWWTVRVRFPDPMASDQVEIAELLSETWTIP